MSSHEKILAWLVGSLAGLLGLGFGAQYVFVKPLNKIDKDIASTRAKLDKVKAERRACFAAEDQVKAFTQRSFATDVDEASAKSGESLTRHILMAGLQESDFTRLPVGPRRLRGASEIGWSVQGDGPLAHVVNLLFVLQESLRLHRIENLSVSPGDAPGKVTVRFRYLTLVMEPAPDVEPIALTPKFTLESPERRIYDGLVARDILRPYLRRVPPHTARGLSAQPGAGTAPAAPPGPESLKVVSLSEWLGQPEVHVRDLANQKTLRYKPGDALGGGTIVCVDYRPLPLPGSAGLKSFSRVILKIGSEYWAIEPGRTLADKHKLSAEQLPEQLAKAP
jgi:hypothetical protein